VRSPSMLRVVPPMPSFKAFAFLDIISGGGIGEPDRSRFDSADRQ
jgi:hypothetical protein